MKVKRKAKREAAVKPAWGEYRFKIDAYTPDTIPMARLAEYMAQLAEILGEKASVHFKKLVAGSTVVVSRIQREAVPKVTARAAAVRRGDAPRDALRAYRTVNKMLRDDDGVGSFASAASNRPLIRFPGRDEKEEQFTSVREQGTLDGIVVRIGGKDMSVHITLDQQGEPLAGIWTNRTIGKQLAHKLFEPVRLFGKGRWTRDSDGIWVLADFKVESFEALDDAPLSAALSDLRSVETEFLDSAFVDLQIIRSGQSKKLNGRH
jgi:hypothetical protein